MKLLVDTQILIWSALSPEKNPPQAQAQLEDVNNTLLFSVISLWEVAIKRAQNRPEFTIEVGPWRDSLFDAGFQELPILSKHVFSLAGLPNLHKDPFDRLLLAQAISENMILLTTDSTLAKYLGPIRYIK